MLKINLYGKKLYHTEEQKERFYKFLKECRDKEVPQINVAIKLKVSQAAICYHAKRCGLRPWLKPPS